MLQFSAICLVGHLRPDVVTFEPEPVDVVTATVVGSSVELIMSSLEAVVPV